MTRNLSIKPLSQERFCIVVDVERNLVVDCGSYVDCEYSAQHFNTIYQSNAYQVKPWPNN